MRDGECGRGEQQTVKPRAPAVAFAAVPPAAPMRPAIAVATIATVAYSKSMLMRIRRRQLVSHRALTSSQQQSVPEKEPQSRGNHERYNRRQFGDLVIRSSGRVVICFISSFNED
jgi:hypothetical protein